jgi:hypothetical protein
MGGANAHAKVVKKKEMLGWCGLQRFVFEAVLAECCGAVFLR